jgi:hypothetical protein
VDVVVSVFSADPPSVVVVVGPDVVVSAASVDVVLSTDSVEVDVDSDVSMVVVVVVVVEDVVDSELSSAPIFWLLCSDMVVSNVVVNCVVLVD